MSAPTRIVSVVGNPRAESRTHGLARTLASALTEVVPDAAVAEVDLAELGAKVLDFGDGEAAAAVETVLAGDILILASPTYKGTYSGLLKAFLDRLSADSLGLAPAIPVLLGGAPTHSLAIDVHLVPLLLELGASIPGRGLFVLESELDAFPDRAAEWVQRRRALFAHVGR